MRFVNSRPLLLFYAVCMIIIGCQSKHSKKVGYHAKLTTKPNKDSLSENFDVFIYNFKSDSVFQRSRVRFPIKIITVGDESDSVWYIAKNKWIYTSFTDTTLRFEKRALTKSSVNMKVYIEDTGFMVDHYFSLKNNQWMLDSIKDESD